MTPMEQDVINTQSFGLRIITNLAVNNMIVQAREYESAWAKIGHGAPPLSETVNIRMMWANIIQHAACAEYES